MKIVYDVLATDDLAEIVDFLEAQGFDRSAKFMKDYRKALQRIRDFPKAWPKFTRKVRVKIISKRFLYGIYYTLTKTEIQIGAIFHLARGSKLWKRRFRK